MPIVLLKRLFMQTLPRAKNPRGYVARHVPKKSARRNR
jgi:hypothetical protein